LGSPCDLVMSLLEPHWVHGGQVAAHVENSFLVTSEVQAISECPLLFQHKVTFDPTSSYTLEDLKPDTLYRFQLAARSDMGVGVFTPTIEARTAQSSKCLWRPLSVTTGLGHTHTHTDIHIHPFPLTRRVVLSLGSNIGL
jgi:hypothetical protein